MNECSCYSAAGCFENNEDETGSREESSAEPQHIPRGGSWTAIHVNGGDLSERSNTEVDQGIIDGEANQDQDEAQQNDDDDGEPRTPPNVGAISDADGTSSSWAPSRLFSGALGTTTVGMTIATFGALGGGKIGLLLTRDIFGITASAIVDSALAIEDRFDEELSMPNTVALYGKVVKRGICWLLIGVAIGLSNSCARITAEPNRFGEAWQFKPILCEFGYCFILIWIIARMMLQAHRDIVPNVWRWSVCTITSVLLSTCGRASPYPLLETIGRILYLVCMTVGLYFLVNYLDRNVERTHLKKGYQLLVGSFATFTSYAVLSLASIDFGYLLINSAAVTLLQKAVLSIVVPALKNCFGNDDRKLWSCAMPAYILGLELGQCVLFLSSNPTNEFWSLVMFQEFNSVLKNTGKYDELYAVVRSRVGRPLDESARKRIEEKRATIAPCDNVGEITSPVVLIVAIGLEALYSSFGFERAPYLADSGILEAWRMDEDGQGRPRGETTRMLTVVLVVRLIFCWLEVKVRHYQKRHAHRDGTAAANGAYQGDGERGTEDGGNEDPNRSQRRPKTRRPSMKVLYDRIVDSREAPTHMKFLAISLFCLQPIILVGQAASIGRQVAQRRGG